MGKKVHKARAIIASGQFVLPSPAEVKAAMTPAGAWTAATLARWGVAWPPERGWRDRLRRQWEIANGIEPTRDDLPTFIADCIDWMKQTCGYPCEPGGTPCKCDELRERGDSLIGRLHRE